MMATAAPPSNYSDTHRFSIEEYHRMRDAGVLDDPESLEFIAGQLVPKMSRNPAHDSTLDRLEDIIRALLPAGWRPRTQKAISLSSGEPEPGIAVVIGPAERCADHHPKPIEIALIVEAADSSLYRDRTMKLPDYARNGIVAHWIVNIEDRQIEVYTDPTTAGEYLSQVIYKPGQHVPLVIAGTEVGTISVDAVL